MTNTVKKNTHSWLWISPILILFGIVYIQSMAFVYVEGDDATSIAYHVMGRNPEIQEAYTPYHGMMDKVLGFLPANEASLRFTSLIATNFAAVLMVILILMLVFDWSRHSFNTYPKWWISIITLLAIPELFFLGMVYSPTLIAMCLLLIAHLLIRRAVQDSIRQDFLNRKQSVFIALSALLFGFGVSFRWNTIVYAGVIVFDLLLLRSDMFSTIMNSIKKQLGICIHWGGLALASSIGMILISGHGYSDFTNTLEVIPFLLSHAGAVRTDTGASLRDVLVLTLLPMSPMFTPVFGLLTLFGFIGFIHRRNPLALITIIGVLGIVPWLKSGGPKFIITSLPVLILCFVYGFTILQDWIEKVWVKRTINSMLAMGLIIPWVIGIQVTREDTAYGPGFIFRPYDYQNTTGLQINPIFDSGAGFPTFEGPRPLFGYGHVLLGGEWREYILTLDDERNVVIRSAISLNYPIVVTDWSPDFYLNKLYSLGYQTDDPAYSKEYFTKRDFIDPEQKTVTIFIHETDETTVENFIEQLSDSTVIPRTVIITGYSSVMRYLYDNFPDAMTLLGRTSAIIDLGKLP